MTLQTELDTLRRGLDIAQNRTPGVWPFERKVLLNNWAEVATPELVRRLLSGYDNCEEFGSVVHGIAARSTSTATKDVTELAKDYVENLEAEVARLSRSIKDHQIAESVNELTVVARQYGHTQQLRERIAQVVRKLVRGV